MKIKTIAKEKMEKIGQIKRFIESLNKKSEKINKHLKKAYYYAVKGESEKYNEYYQKAEKLIDDLIRRFKNQGKSICDIMIERAIKAVKKVVKNDGNCIIHDKLFDRECIVVTVKYGIGKVGAYITFEEEEEWNYNFDVLAIAQVEIPTLEDFTSTEIFGVEANEFNIFRNNHSNLSWEDAIKVFSGANFKYLLRSLHVKAFSKILEEVKEQVYQWFYLCEDNLFVEGVGKIVREKLMEKMKKELPGKYLLSRESSYSYIFYQDWNKVGPWEIPEIEIMKIRDNRRLEGDGIFVITRVKPIQISDVELSVFFAEDEEKKRFEEYIENSNTKIFKENLRDFFGEYYEEVISDAEYKMIRTNFIGSWNFHRELDGILLEVEKFMEWE